MSFNLPLSWTWTEADELSFQAVPLPSGTTFIAGGDVPCAYADKNLGEVLKQRFPQGFLLRGVDEELASQIAPPQQHLCLGSSALIELSTHKPDKKMRNLVRRGQQEVECSRVELDQHGIQAIEKFQAEIRTDGEPAIRYFFRTDISTCQAAFAAYHRESRAMVGALALSRYGQAGWHSELIMRHPSAPPGTMESLIASVIDTAKGEQIAALNLGEVPLNYPGAIEEKLTASNSSLAQKFLARYGSALTKLTSNTYNVEGLYRFKDKFSPQWEPRYFVAWPKMRLRDLWAVVRLSQAIKLVRVGKKGGQAPS